MKSVILSAALLFTVSSYAATSTLQVDSAASEVKWTGSKVAGGSHHGTVKIASGKVEMDGKNLKGGDFVIDMKSINNEDLKDKPKDKAKLEGHLKSDDFFGVNVKGNETATFKIEKVVPSKTKGFTHDVTGVLVVKQKPETLTFPVNVVTTDAGATATGTVEFDRAMHDVKFASKKFFENLVGDKVINDKIKMELKVVAKK